MTEPPVHLVPGADRGAEVDALANRLGGRVGLDGVLADLDRTAKRVRVPARAASWGFRWDREDMRSKRWWPQGISTPPDDLSGHDTGREVLVTSAYARPVDGVEQGARLTFVDVTDRDAIRYRHVLLVEASLREDGAVAVRPVRLHAGGIVWHAGHVHAAGTLRGLATFRLDDVLRIRDRTPTTPAAFGHRYVLPLRFTYDAGTAEGAQRMRYSFISLDRSVTPPQLVAGEYSRTGPTRLARFDLDGTTGLLVAPGGRAAPRELHEHGPPGMQGAVSVDGRWYVTTSHGPLRLGSLWAGRPGELRRHRWALPIGPEDLASWPERDELWSLSEYPGARYVFAMPRSRFDP